MKKIAFISTLIMGSLFAQSPYAPQVSIPVPSVSIPTPSVSVTTPSSQSTVTSRASNVIDQDPNTVGCNISQTPGIGNSCVITVESNGVGVAPNNSISPAQATAMARRAAIIDGYKALTEKLYGIKINGKETVRNMVLQNSNLHSKILGVIRGATIEEENYKNGMYKIVMSVKLNVGEWNRYLKKGSVYSN